MQTPHERGPTPAPSRSQLDRLLEPDAFLWLTGIEDTFVFDPHHVTGRILDEYALTKHYERWREDLDLMGTLGVPAARYGIPWYKIQPARDKWDWTFADQTLERMLELGIHPVVDLVHYGTPEWMENGFLHPDFPKFMAEYGARTAERFKGRIRWYTPLNEPRITAHYCGRIGWWPPFRHGWSGLVSILTACAKGIAATDRALKEVDPEIVCLHVDAMDTYETRNPEFQEKADFKQSLVFLPMDMVMGRIDDTHGLRNWLRGHGMKDADVAWLQENQVTPDVIGLNMYPMFSRREVIRSGGEIKYAARYGDREMVKFLGRAYYERYGRPMLISETASRGTHKRRIDWLHESLAGVRELRAEGVPMIGYTWWPMFSLIGWAYRQKQEPLAKYIVPMGLWDLAGEDLERVSTPVVDAYREEVAKGSLSVGPLNREVGADVS